jgi:hypothetical protein
VREEKPLNWPFAGIALLRVREEKPDWDSTFRIDRQHCPCARGKTDRLPAYRCACLDYPCGKTVIGNSPSSCEGGLSERERKNRSIEILSCNRMRIIRLRKEKPPPGDEN